MVIELELAIVIGLLAHGLLRKGPARITPVPLIVPAEEAPPPEPAEGVRRADIRVRTNDGFIYCYRPQGHPDLREFLETPGFYLEHPDGRTEQGTQ